MSLVAYLASPFSHEREAVRRDRVYEAEKAVAWLMKRRFWAYSPIVHNNRIQAVGDLPGNYEFWLTFDREMVKRCDLVVVLGIEGWKESKGVDAEIKFATGLRMPVLILTKCEDEYVFSGSVNYYGEVLPGGNGGDKGEGIIQLGGEDGKT